MAENVEKNQLPSKSVMSASYHELDTPPPEQDVDERTLFYLRMGVLHSYRTLFYETKVSTGPFEQVLTVGPTETVEVLVEVARRSTIEEESESKTESSEESQSEGRLTEELTDKVATVIQRSSTSSASLSVSGAYSVFSGSASGNSSYSNSRTDSTERVKRIVKETSQRVTNQFMKSFTLRTRRTEEVTTRDVHRRLIRNETDRSRHFGLRRLQQSYRASTQYRGPRLVWHVGVSYPGAALGTPRLISTDIVAGPFLQRAMRELKTAQQSARVAYPTAQGSQAYNLTPFRLGPDARMLSGQFDNSRQVIAVTSQGTDAGGNPWSVDFAISVETKETNPTTGEVSVQVVATKHATLGAPPASIQVVIPNIVVLYVSRALEATWATPAGATFKDFLDKYRALLIDMRSTKIRPSGDLRREERDELLRRALSGIQRFDPLFEINSFEIERLSTIFETDSAFYRLYPPYFSKRSFTDSTTSASSQSREYDLAQEQLPVPVQLKAPSERGAYGDRELL
ncbi:MAG: hypothetical protein SXG53_15360, partial [Pseudomonadota bacterium]|nr:hypothetical protein [Pseudomonadota bacterium]